MKEEINKLIGAERAAKVEAKAEKRGIVEIWKRAEERAIAELGLAGRVELLDVEKAALVRRVAERAQQITGCIPRFLPPTAETPVQEEIPATEKKPSRSKRSEPEAKVETPAEPAPEAAAE